MVDEYEATLGCMSVKRVSRLWYKLDQIDWRIFPKPNRHVVRKMRDKGNDERQEEEFPYHPRNLTFSPTDFDSKAERKQILAGKGALDMLRGGEGEPRLVQR